MGVKQPSDKLYQVVSVADFLTARRIEATTLPELSWESWTGNATMPISWTELQSSFFHWISEGLGYVPTGSYKSRLFNEHLIAALHNKCLMFCLRKTECKNEKGVTMGSVGLRGFRTRPWMGVVSVDILSLSLSLPLWVYSLPRYRLCPASKALGGKQSLGVDDRWEFMNQSSLSKLNFQIRNPLLICILRTKCPLQFPLLLLFFIFKILFYSNKKQIVIYNLFYFYYLNILWVFLIYN